MKSAENSLYHSSQIFTELPKQSHVLQPGAAFINMVQL